MTRRSLLCLLVGFLLVLGACSSTSLPPEQSFPGDQDLAFVEGEPQTTFRLALQQPPTTDPAVINLADQAQVIVADLLYDGLVEVSPDGQLAPALATAWTDHNMVRWSFELDTSRINSQQVKSSFERLLAEQPESLSAAALRPVIGASGVRAGETAQAAGIIAAEDGRIDFELSQPQAGFAWLLAGLQFSVVGDNGTLTGRYIITEESEERALLESAEGIDVELRWQDNAIEAYQELALGKVDAALVDGSLIDGASSRYGSGKTARNVVRFLGLNELSPDLVAKETRQALLAALDRERMTSDWDRAVFAVDGVVAPSVRGYRVGGCGSTCSFDPSLTREVLASIGSAPSLTLSYVADRDTPVADAAAAMLTEAGFEIEVQQVTAAELAEGIANGSAELFISGWISPAGSTDAVIPYLFGSQSELNVTRISNEAVDELLAAASILSDDTLRWALLAQAEQAALEDAILAPLGVDRSLLVSTPTAPPHSVRSDGSLSLG